MKITLTQVDFKKKPFPVWRGFRHNWLYNHRTNRIGSFVNKKNTSCYVNHSGASGTGPDMLHFEDEYTIVDAENTSFTIQKISFTIEEKKGKTATFRKDIIVKKTSDDTGSNIGAVLNGFDLVSTKSSSKLHFFDLKIDKKVKNNETVFTVSISINLDCKSVECIDKKKDYNYNLDVYVLIVKGENLAYEKISGTISNRYSWKKRAKKNEIQLLKDGIKDNEKILLKTGFDDFSNHVIGYRRLKILIHNQEKGPDNTVHMLGLNYNITDIRKTSLNRLKLNLEIFFRNWRVGMKKSGNMSFWSFRQKGSFHGSVKFAALRFKTAKIKARKNIGQIEWKGKDMKATSSKALSSKKIDFDFDLLA